MFFFNPHLRKIILSTFDYIVLIYSGGVDSHTVLETFLKNNIHINEICSFGNPELVDKTKSINIEVFNAALPFIDTLDLKKLGRFYPQDL